MGGGGGAGAAPSLLSHTSSSRPPPGFGALLSTSPSQFGLYHWADSQAECGCDRTEGLGGQLEGEGRSLGNTGQTRKPWGSRETPGAGPRKGGASGTHLLLESCEPCCPRAGAGGAEAASPAPRTPVSAPPRLCRRRCTCRRAAACALTPCRAAAGGGLGRHLPRGRLAQARGAPGNAARVSARVPGSRTSSSAIDRAVCAPQP